MHALYSRSAALLRDCLLGLADKCATHCLLSGVVASPLPWALGGAAVACLKLVGLQLSSKLLQSVPTRRADSESGRCARTYTIFVAAHTRASNSTMLEGSSSFSASRRAACGGDSPANMPRGGSSVPPSLCASAASDISSSSSAASTTSQLSAASSPSSWRSCSSAAGSSLAPADPGASGRPRRASRDRARESSAPTAASRTEPCALRISRTSSRVARSAWCTTATRPVRLRERRPCARVSKQAWVCRQHLEERPGTFIWKRPRKLRARPPTLLSATTTPRCSALQASTALCSCCATYPSCWRSWPLNR